MAPLRRILTHPKRLLTTTTTTTSSPLPMQQPPPKIHWVLDWDSTITTHDTLSSLAEIPATASPPRRDLLRQEWTRLTQAYAADLSLALQPPTTNDPSKPSDAQKQSALDAVEQTSLNRVMSSLLFANLTLSHIASGAREAVSNKAIQPRNGFAAFHDRHLTRSCPLPTTAPEKDEEGKEAAQNWTILSVNWSRHFIASCLSAMLEPHAFDASSVNVISNGLEGIEVGERKEVSTGGICSTHPAVESILSGKHKQAILSTLRNAASLSSLESESESELQGGGAAKTALVYMGDSATDLECLLDADLGICIRDEAGTSAQRELRAALEKNGVECVPLGDVGRDVLRGKRGGDGRKVVAWVRDFEEVNAWLDGML